MIMFITKLLIANIVSFLIYTLALHPFSTVFGALFLVCGGALLLQAIPYFSLTCLVMKWFDLNYSVSLIIFFVFLLTPWLIHDLYTSLRIQTSANIQKRTSWPSGSVGYTNILIVPPESLIK